MQLHTGGNRGAQNAQIARNRGINQSIGVGNIHQQHMRHLRMTALPGKMRRIRHEIALTVRLHHAVAAGADRVIVLPGAVFDDRDIEHRRQGRVRRMQRQHNASVPGGLDGRHAGKPAAVAGMFVFHGHSERIDHVFCAEHAAVCKQHAFADGEPEFSVFIDRLRAEVRLRLIGCIHPEQRVEQQRIDVAVRLRRSGDRVDAPVFMEGHAEQQVDSRFRRRQDGRRRCRRRRLGFGGLRPSAGRKQGQRQQPAGQAPSRLISFTARFRRA